MKSIRKYIRKVISSTKGRKYDLDHPLVELHEANLEKYKNKDKIAFKDEMRIYE